MFQCIANVTISSSQEEGPVELMMHLLPVEFSSVENYLYHRKAFQTFPGSSLRFPEVLCAHRTAPQWHHLPSVYAIAFVRLLFIAVCTKP